MDEESNWKELGMPVDRKLLEEMASNEEGLLKLRTDVMGAAGEIHRQRADAADVLVRKGLARWRNRTLVQITTAGRAYLEE